MQRIKEGLESKMAVSLGTVVFGLKIAFVVLATVAVFFQDLVILFNDALGSEATGYVLAIPPIVAYLLYRKRKMIKASASRESSRSSGNIPLNEVVGALLLLTSLLLYWYGSYTFTPLEYHLFALPFFACSLIVLFFNMQTLRQAIAPVIFLFLLTPPPAEILYNLGSLFSIASSRLAYSLLSLFRFPAVIGEQYGTPSIFVTQQNGMMLSFQVDIACSGLYSQLGFFVFAVFITYLVRDRTWKKMSIFLLGFPLIYLLNVLRIFTIVAIGYSYGADLALNIFHFLGGWVLVFLGALLLLFVSDRILKARIFSVNTKSPLCSADHMISKDFCLTCGRFSPSLRRFIRRDVAKIVVLGLIVSVVVAFQTPVFALRVFKTGPVEIASQTPQASEVLPPISGYLLDFEERDTQFEQISKQDASLVYKYVPANSTERTIFASIEIASVTYSLHRWETCLVTWPERFGYAPKVTSIELKDIQLLENPPLIARYFVFNITRTNVTQAVLYWYQTSIFKINSTSRTRNVKISLTEFPHDLTDLPDVETELLFFAKTISSDWKATGEWSALQLLISQNGDKLVISTVTALGAVLAVHVFERRRRRQESNVVYEKLPETTKQVVRAVFETEKKNGLPTLSNISKAYEAITGKTSDVEQLLSSLVQLEKTDVIRVDIANLNDEPVRVWRTQLSRRTLLHR